MKSIAVIGARLNSSRLPRKHLLPLAGKPLIEHLVQRLNHCQKLDKTILATTDDAFNQDLVTWAEGKIACLPFSGDVNDLMGRIHAVVQAENPDYITYICGDCPLVEPSFIDHGLHELISHQDADKVELHTEIKSIHEGIEIYSRAGWETLYQASNTAMTREHVGYAHKQNPCLNILHITDSNDYSSINHRISVDTPSDYTFMKAVYERWYHTHPSNSIVDLRWVQSQLIADKELSEVNQHVQQKMPEKQYKQVSLFTHVSKRIGMGHLKRTAAIASALQEHLGVGTCIHILGEERSLPWLTTKTCWYTKENSFIHQMETNTDDLWVIDLHPEHCDITTIKHTCGHAKSTTRPEKKQTSIIAVDKLTALLPVVDELFIPSFYCEQDDPRISYGWQNYFLTPKPHQAKKNQILVLTGGSDALNYGDNLPTLIETIAPHDWDLTWVQGPYAKAPNTSARWQIQHNPTDLKQLMESSKIIASCYGLSLFEAIASGALTHLMPVKHLCEANELQALKDQNVCRISDDFESLSNMLYNSIHHFEEYTSILNNARQVFSNTNGIREFTAHAAKLL